MSLKLLYLLTESKNDSNTKLMVKLKTSVVDFKKML